MLPSMLLYTKTFSSFLELRDLEVKNMRPCRYTVNCFNHWHPHTKRTHCVIISHSLKEALNTLGRKKDGIYPLPVPLWKTCAFSGTGIPVAQWLVEKYLADNKNLVQLVWNNGIDEKWEKKKNQAPRKSSNLFLLSLHFGIRWSIG